MQRFDRVINLLSSQTQDAHMNAENITTSTEFFFRHMRHSTKVLLNVCMALCSLYSVGFQNISLGNGFFLVTSPKSNRMPEQSAECEFYSKADE